MRDCEVLARVNGQVLVASDVLWQVNLLLEKHRDKIPPDQLETVTRTLMRQHLMMMLDMRMAYSDFRSSVPDANIEGIREKIAPAFEEMEVPRLMKIVGVEDRRLLEKRLIELGTSERERREDFSVTMIARQWVSESIELDRTVTHEQLLEYYQQHAADYEYPTQARWEELMVRFDRFPEKSAAYRALAELGNRAFRAMPADQPQGDKSGPAFAQIAREGSHGFTADKGGVHDWTRQGSLASATIDEAIFTVPVGQMSPIVESPIGFHIVRVLERKEAGRTPFTEVQVKIREAIIDARTKRAFEERLKKLRQSARIWTVYDGEVSAAEYAAAKEKQEQQR